ncbi:prepilin-type N-terminal cleavage/methylation domain-containing protein [Alteribacter aurantiacus]|uniref:prepilin-type N-terminal cleavage/methylation domain-containing protein n=1 Tax=Alteribacter aurantiacus TaxID=254410 RepID=UPI0004115CBE|nr:prepilin-type N-terminal cleavage/methylation domain-containing protein [Alteribacter aurantiacus]
MNKYKQKLRTLLRNEKGLTLVELLAVIVILGIIAAIAIPAIGGIIDNSKKDAHIANAETVANAARLYATSNDVQGNKVIDISNATQGSEGLVQLGYVDKMPDNPDGSGDYHDGFVIIEKTGNSYSYYVQFLHSEGDGDVVFNTSTSGSTKVVSSKTGVSIEHIRSEGRSSIAD